MTMRLNRPKETYLKASDNESPGLIDIITSTKCYRLLRLFVYKPRYEMYQSELIKESGLSPNTAVPLLNKLVSYGIVDENIVAGTKFYSVKEENPVIKQLKILANVSSLYESIRIFSDDTEVYLFGSASRGEDTENSDIDLLVIANGDKKSLSMLKEKIKDTLTDKLRREVNPVIFTPIEYASLYNKDKAFYNSIEKDKIRVL